MEWSGVFPAILCPFQEDWAIDEGALRSYAAWLAAVRGIRGLVVNGHTGEVHSLRPRERARVTEIVAREVGSRVRVVSGISAEGSLEAIDHAREAKEAGADAILLMPPHHWLRFGRSSETALGFFEDVAQAVDIPMIVHQYPAWTKAGYTLEEMLALVRIPNVVSIKMGTRDMARYGHDFRVLQREAPEVTILTCHDEYLLPTLLEGAHGALVGFAGFVPDLIVELVEAALARDLPRALQVQEKLYPLARLVYRFGEPSGDAHQRMKAAMALLGRLPSGRVRPPLRPLPEAELQRIRRELAEAGLLETRPVPE